MKTIKDIPKGRLIVYGLLFIFIVIYLLWATFKKPAASTEVFQETKPAIKTPKVAGPIIKVPIRVLPKPAVIAKIPEATIFPEEEFINAGKIPPAPYGGVTLDKINVTTGEAKEEFKANKAPWFALEDKNYIGAGYRLSTDGATVPVYFKRDLFQVKEFHFQIEVGGRVPAEPLAKGELHIGANAEYRFNGFNPFK